MKRQKGQKGDGKAGGGLAARITEWESMPKASGIAHNAKKVDGLTYIRPGSQNHKKGGRGK